MPVSEKKKASNARYDAGHTVQIHLKLNTGTDADILEWLDRSGNKQGEIKRLIREQIKKERQ